MDETDVRGYNGYTIHPSFSFLPCTSGYQRDQTSWMSEDDERKGGKEGKRGGMNKSRGAACDLLHYKQSSRIDCVKKMKWVRGGRWVCECEARTVEKEGRKERYCVVCVVVE